MPSFILPLERGGFVVGNEHALQLFDGEQVTGEIDRVAMRANNRFNDATVDKRGRLWFGSMDKNETQLTGAVHVHEDGEISIVGGESVITNGPAVTHDGEWLYHVDTPARTIWRFNVGNGSRLDDGEVFVRIEDEAGNPDGIVLDAEDHLWVGLWGGWAARRYAPDGRLVQEVRFPCANITKIAFGGANLKTAFATSARIGLDEEALSVQPLAGGLFAFDVDVPGAIMPCAKLGA